MKSGWKYTKEAYTLHRKECLLCPELKTWRLTLFAFNLLDWYIMTGHLLGEYLELEN